METLMVESPKKPTNDVKIIRKKYNFRWEVLDVIIGGKSLLDSDLGLTGFPMRSKEDADEFLRSYGYDLDDPIENAEILGHFRESIKFIEKFFLQPENPEGLKLDIPRKVLEVADVRDLLLMASMSYPGQMSDTQGIYLRDWACAILKVVHSIVHIDKDIRYTYFSDIQKQILDRFYKVIHRREDGKLVLGKTVEDPCAVELVEFETKSKKARESVLMKMLHKPESVADEIFDRVGLRFVTPTMLGALRCVKYLKDLMIVMPVNIKPSRSRNTLIELDSFKDKLEPLMGKAELGQLDQEGFRSEIEKLIQKPQINSENPHSSDDYRSIQFTCRQLIKLKNPLHENLRELKTAAKKQEKTELTNLIEKVDLQYLQREIRFFYPYEIQIFDQNSWKENESGSGAHREYKKSQLQTAMNRVMGNLMDVAR